MLKTSREALTEGAAWARFQYRRARLLAGCANGLDFIWLEITRRCNLSCRHCYAESGPHLPLREEMKDDDWLRVLDEAHALGCRNLQFIGGEPTLHPSLPLFIEHASEAGFLFCEVFTNGTKICEGLLDHFEEHRVSVALSFYSAEPADHDRFTARRRSFERTAATIEKLVERSIPLRVDLIGVDMTQLEEREARRFLQALGVESIGVDRVRGVGRGATLVPAARPFDELCGHCWRRSLAIDARGNAYGCVFSRFAPVGNVRAESLETVVGSPQLAAFRRAVFLGHRNSRRSPIGHEKRGDLGAPPQAGRGEPEGSGTSEGGANATQETDPLSADANQARVGS